MKASENPELKIINEIYYKCLSLINCKDLDTNGNFDNLLNYLKSLNLLNVSNLEILHTCLVVLKPIRNYDCVREFYINLKDHYYKVKGKSYFPLYSILCLPNAVEYLKELDRTGELNIYFHELTKLKKTNGGLNHKDNFIHTLKVLQNVIDADLCIEQRLVAVFHDLGKAKAIKQIDGNNFTFHDHENISAKMLLKLYKRFNIPMNTYDFVHTVVELHGRTRALYVNDVLSSDSAIRRLAKDAGIYFSDLIDFNKMDITTSMDHYKNKYKMQYNNVYLRHLEIIKADIIAAWQPEFRGVHIIELGFKGRMIGDIKQDVINKIKNNELENTIESCKAYVIKNYQVG